MQQAVPDIVDEQLAHSNNHSQIYACETCPFVAKRLLKGFTREMYNWRRMSLMFESEHLVSLASCFLGWDEKGSGDYVVMPRLRPLPARACPRAALALCLCVREMCRRGIYHLDIKPANIMLGDKDQYVLIDYGLMCFTPSEHDFPGTRGFIDKSTTDSESRVVYALGQTLAKMRVCPDRVLEYTRSGKKRTVARLCEIYSSPA